MDNSSWAFCIIDQLIQQGIVDFCIAPGSRSTPLALAAARHPKALLKVHFDERGLGFYALGISTVYSKPAALIVTSGTAVGNLLPSVMEAYHSRIPLILLTADRPPELRECNANQTTDQINFFSRYVLWHTDLPCPCSELNEDFIRYQITYAVFHALRKGPVHLNCPFREPLFSAQKIQKEGRAQQFFFPQLTIDSWTQKECQNLIKSAERGLILIGRMPFDSDLSSLFLFAHQLGWPIFADLLSSVRSRFSFEGLISHFDYALRSQKVPIPDLIIHFGGRFTSKALLEWIKQNQIQVLQVSSDPNRTEPLQATRVWADPVEFCKNSARLKKSLDRSWLNTWKQIDQQISLSIEEVFASPHPFTEPDLMRTLSQELPENWAIFLANSMPLRDAEHFLFPSKINHIFCNRGLSGIDGQIATAVGIATRLQQPVCAILGDQSCLHDLNSFALLSSLQIPFLLIISNNFGGGIFSHLPVAHEQEHFELLWGVGHEFQFEHIAALFKIPYQKGLPFFPCDRPSIIEITTSRQENTKFRNLIEDRLCSVTC